MDELLRISQLVLASRVRRRYEKPPHRMFTPLGTGQEICLKVARIFSTGWGSSVVGQAF